VSCVQNTRAYHHQQQRHDKRATRTTRASAARRLHECHQGPNSIVPALSVHTNAVTSCHTHRAITELAPQPPPPPQH
jgi:hypothetical protein